MYTSKMKMIVVLVFLVGMASLITMVSAQDDPSTSVEIIGEIETINGETITVNQIEIDISNAEINVDLEVAIVVKVEGALTDDGSVIAREINAVDSGLLPGEVEIVGLLESISQDSITVNGIMIDITEAEVDRTIFVGDTVKVHATIDDTGDWIAREVEAIDFISGDDSSNNDDRNDNDNSNDNNDNDSFDEDFKLIGVLESVEDETIVVSGVEINISNAEIEDRLINGVLVRIELRIVDEVLVASEVRLANARDFDDDSDDFVLPNDCSQPRGWIEYRVQSGDTLSSIAARTGTTVNILASVNCIDNPSLISVGTNLFVPRQLDDRTLNDNFNGNDNFNDNDDDDNFNDNDDDDNFNDNDDDDDNDNDDDDNSGHGSNDNDDDDDDD